MRGERKYKSTQQHFAHGHAAGAIARAHRVGKAFPVEPMTDVERRIAAALAEERAEKDGERITHAGKSWDGGL